MKKLLWIVMGLMCFGASPAGAHDESMKNCPTPPPSSTELDAVKKLTGFWRGEMAPVPAGQKSAAVETEFKVISGGSAVEETLMGGTPHEMVDMYYDEEGKINMTHYCAMGNRPHMVLKESTPTSLSFEMSSTKGISRNDTHMHELTLDFPDATHLTERWTSYMDGKPAETVVFTFTRPEHKKHKKKTAAKSAKTAPAAASKPK